jgi:hypothetical protein
VRGSTLRPSQKGCLAARADTAGCRPHRERELCHAPARDAERIPSSAAPAPPNIAAQIYTPATMTKMIAHCTQGGESIDQAIAWGADELEGFMRG